MNSSAIIPLLLGALTFLGGLGFLVYAVRKFILNPLTDRLNKKELIYYFSSIGAVALGLAFLVLGLFLAHPEWQSETSYASGLFAGSPISWRASLALALAGSFFFALSGAFLWSAFGIHYWKKKLEAAQKRLFAFLLFGSIPFFAIFFLMAMEGLAPYLYYPLLNGFEFTTNGFRWTTAFDMGGYQGLHIAFYGIIMLFGVCVSYWVCDHEFYKEFHKHGILDNLVLVVFPAGVIGARIWYVVGNYQREFASQSFWQMFAVWDGGLTILGGAFAGIVAGFLFLKIRRKYINIRWAMDVCVPSILLAQAVGRWGNFFNCEVYGKVASLSQGWSWLPSWIAQQMNCNSGGGNLSAGSINIPLFLVEGLLSLIGYFVIVFAVGKGLKKYLVKGDLAGFYFLWYGLVRVIMEPMRNAQFNMGADNAWSICNSLVYIAIGLAIIMALHLHDFYLAKRKAFPFALVAAILMGIGLIFPVMSSLTASSGNPAYAGYKTEVFGGFELLFGGKAPALLAAYFLLVAAFVLFGVSFLLVELKKERQSMIAIWVGASAAIAGSLMFLLGKDWTTLGYTLDIGTVTYSLSYGFVLAAIFGLWAAAIGLTLVLSTHEAAKADQLAQSTSL
jgi:phosphatidylglycerol:prolipoprotein diacylglycerol transferase